MKKVLLLLIMGIAALGLSAQQKVAKFEGVIAHHAVDSVYLFVQEHLLGPQISYGSKVGPTGNFRFAIPVNESKSALFRAGDKGINLYFSPGDMIRCTFNQKSVYETLAFTGNNAGQYNYFIDYYRKYGLQHGMFFKPGYSDVFTLKPLEFKDYRRGKVSDDLKFLKDYATSHSLTKDFRAYAEADIMYSYFYALLSYSSFRKSFKKIDETLPQGFYGEISKELFNRNDILNNEHYLNAMNMYMSEIVTGEFKDVGTFYQRAFELAPGTLSGKSLYLYQAGLLKGMLNSATKATIKESLTARFLDSCPFVEYKQRVISALEKFRMSESKLLPQKVLDSELMDSHGVNILFKEILQANKGNVIYIDFWASWCGPCKIEMPHSKKLGEKFKDKPVKFIYFSVDASAELWRRALVSWKIEGQNYMLLNQLKSPLAGHFNISGIPHYILIDKKGEIAFSSAARPSSVGIISAIEALISAR